MKQIRKVWFSTMEILLRKQQQLQASNQQRAKKQVPKPQLASLDEWYFRSCGMEQIQEYKQKTQPNIHLISGREYTQYPLSKLLHIALHLIQQGQPLPPALITSIQPLIRNTTISDNILLLHVALYGRCDFLTEVTVLLGREIKYMGVSDILWLFYVACDAGMARLTTSLVKQMEKQGRVQNDDVVQWLMLNAYGMRVPTRKIEGTLQHCVKHLTTSKHPLTDTQLVRSLSALHFRMGLCGNSCLSTIIQRYLKKVEGRCCSLPLTRILALYYPHTYSLTGDHILSPLFTPVQQLESLYSAWKHDHLHQHEAEAIYRSIHVPQLADGFASAALVVWLCRLELALNSRRQWKKIMGWVETVKVIPRGLEWWLYNYAHACGSQDAQLLRTVKGLLERTYKENEVGHHVERERSRLMGLAQVQEVRKFLHSVRMWHFTPTPTIAPIFYIGHFGNHQHRVLLHCYTSSDCLPGTKQINHECKLTEALLHHHFGYSTVRIYAEQFSNMTFNERIMMITSQIQNNRPAMIS